MASFFLSSCGFDFFFFFFGLRRGAGAFFLSDWFGCVAWLISMLLCALCVVRCVLCFRTLSAVRHGDIGEEGAEGR